MTKEEQLAADMKKAIKAIKEALRLQQQTGDSKVPDEGKGSSTTKTDTEINWGSEDDSHQSNDEHVNEGDITWLSTDEEEKGNEDDDDRSIDIEETDDERTNLENGDHAMTDVDKIVVEKLEEEKDDVEEEQANDDQAQEDQAEDDIVGTLVTMSQKEKPKVLRLSFSHSLSSNYGNQFLNVSSDTSLVGIIKDHADTEINSLLDVEIQQEIPPVLSAPLLDVLVSVIPPPTTTTTTPTPLTTPLPIPPIVITTHNQVSTLEKDVKELKQVDHTTVFVKSIRYQVPPALNESRRLTSKKIIKIKQEHASKQKWPNNSTTPFDKTTENEYKQKNILFKMMMASKSYEKHPYKALYDAHIQSLFMDEDYMDQAVATMDQSAQLKRKHDDQDEDLTARSIQGKDKKNLIKDTQPSKKSYASKESSKGNTPPKTSKSGKSVTVEEPDKEHVHEMSIYAKENIIHDMGNADEQPNDLVGPVYNLLKGTCQSSIELEYNMEECYKALTDQLDWENPKGDRYPFDLTKPLHLKGHPGHLTIALEYFFNNDLEYLKSKDLERKSQLNRFSKHYVFSLLKIMSVVSVKVNNLHGYGYLEDIVVALRMFTRSLIIKKRVKDVQLGVESYQKKLNITRPQKDFPTIFDKEPYTPLFDPQGFVYEDLSNRKTLMRADELYKFSDGTLKSVRDTLHHRLRNFRLGYNRDMPRRKWSAMDQRRSGIMVDLIDKQLLETKLYKYEHVGPDDASSQKGERSQDDEEIMYADGLKKLKIIGKSS
ncbi:hypothetical protein Tco_0614450 [Tanacetum coccineum]